MRDDAVDQRVRRRVLAQGVDAVVGEDQGVQGVDPLFRRGGGVGGPAPELNVHRQAGDVLGGSLVPVAGMDAQGGVHVLEKALAHEAALRAAVFAALLAGRAVHAHLAARFVDHLFERGRGQGRGGPKEVMPAPVAEARQRVVLRQKDQHGPGLFRLVHRGKPGAVARHVHGDGKALGL